MAANIFFKIASKNLIQPLVNCVGHGRITIGRTYAMTVHDPLIGKSITSRHIIDYIGAQNNLPVSKHAVNFEPFHLSQIRQKIVHSTEAKVEDLLLLYRIYGSCTKIQLRELIDPRKEPALEGCMVNAIPLMSIDQLALLGVCLKAIHSTGFGNSSLSLVRSTLGDHCIDLCASASKEDCLKLSSICMMIKGTVFFSRHPKFMNICDRIYAFHSELSTEQMVQLIFMASINNLVADETLGHLYDIVKQGGSSLSLRSAGILANSLFDTELHFDCDDSFLLHLCRILKERLLLEEFLSDPMEVFACVKIVKVLNKFKVRDEELIQALRFQILNSGELALHSKDLCSLSSYFASTRYYDEELCAMLENILLSTLESNKSEISIKDLSLAVGIMASLGYKCSDTFLDVLQKNISKLSLCGEIYNQKNNAIDCVLGLIFWGRYPESVIRKITNQQAFKQLEETLTERMLSRMLVVQQACHGKFKEELLPVVPEPDQLPKHTLRDELECRSTFPVLQESFRWLSQQLSVDSVFEFSFLIPHINSASIVVNPDFIKDSNPSTDYMKKLVNCLQKYDNSSICIEIDDENTTLNNDKSSPYGFDILKRKLLQERNWQVVTIQSEDLVEHTDNHALISFIIDKIVQHFDKKSSN